MTDPNRKWRVFIDANVLFAGIVFPRWPREVLRYAAAGDIQLVLSPLVVQQARRNLQKRFPDYVDRFEEFLQVVDCELVPDPTPEKIEANKNLVRDLSDVAVALAAIAAKVDYLVSEDKDFTVRDETTVELRRHLKVAVSGTFLREVMGWTGEQLEAIRYRKWGDTPEEKSEGVE
jgi:predicted nucleic acid-binding protein